MPNTFQPDERLERSRRLYEAPGSLPMRVPGESIAEFSIPFSRYLNFQGRAEAPFPDDLDAPEVLLRFYRTMVRCRVLDQKAVVLQRIGKLGTYASCLGHEAAGTGAGYALRKEDVFVPYYRDLAIQLLRGVTMKEILLFWGGDERGSRFGGAAAQDFPNCIPIATQVTHAAGVATAIRARRERRAVLTTCGDGATSRGDFAESLNLAGAWQLPLVVLVVNNGWAISVPLKKQTGAGTLAQKAVAAEIRGEQVDGNDVVAVHHAVNRALNEARRGRGPTLIEAVTYRLADHTTADDATRYRSGDELREAWEAEPIKRLRTYLHGRGLWDEDRERELHEACGREVETAVAEYLAEEPEPPEAMFDHLHQELPRALKSQRESLLRKNQNSSKEAGHE